MFTSMLFFITIIHIFEILILYNDQITKRILSYASNYCSGCFYYTLEDLKQLWENGLVKVTITSQWRPTRNYESRY